jgi:hypothetical protein
MKNSDSKIQELFEKIKLNPEPVVNKPTPLPSSSSSSQGLPTNVKTLEEIENEMLNNNISGSSSVENIVIIDRFLNF